ncbi:inorganic phosphate transporter, PiT family [Desulfofundulus australicus DSM 11792]|uniref:Inorganic phosphate transporter, PiT family n=1 Tax=Desulfofundulus australicus DSM 11792 TaxID=1121425 RepID=A0A1M4X393_9FIRM|nr:MULTISPECIES: inorganic phosphate transporter [Desulfofundulus]SHE87931.1 inorganic phosphate transporter, PiT family [Desulfofundulus australicus DSM 11792]
MFSPELLLIFVIIVLALTFDFINGFHDTANAIATSISTKALRPRTAIILASVMNFVGAMTFTGVAKTIGGKIADPFSLSNGLVIVLAALVAASAWNLITWYYGLPSSSSHALIGSLTGAVITAAGFSAVNFQGFINILEALVFSPLLAAATGFTVMTLIKLIFRKAIPHRINRRFRMLQVFTAAFQAFSHGTNDAQKTMGIITFALVAGGFQNDLSIPFWVKFSAALAMALGTSVGGWRIIRTVGTRIIKLEPGSGFSADLSSALVILGATLLKLPVSTTHVISSSIIGVGAARRFSMVKWGTAQKIVAAWVVTLPVTAVLAGISYGLYAGITRLASVF